MKTIFLPLIPLIVGAALSEWCVKKAWIPSYLWPAPSQVIQALIEDQARMRLALKETLFASVLGLLLSAGLGVICAVLISLSEYLKKMFLPYALLFQTVPIIAIAPLLVIWFGYGLPTVVASSFIVSFFPVLANTLLGLSQTDPLLVDFYKLQGASPRQILFQLRLRAALPSMVGGIKISAGLAVIGSIVGEFISGLGLGGVIDAARNQQRIDQVFAALLLASLAGLLFFSVVSAVERFVQRREG